MPGRLLPKTARTRSLVFPQQAKSRGAGMWRHRAKQCRAVSIPHATAQLATACNERNIDVGLPQGVASREEGVFTYGHAV